MNSEFNTQRNESPEECRLCKLQENNFQRSSNQLAIEFVRSERLHRPRNLIPLIILLIIKIILSPSGVYAITAISKKIKKCFEKNIYMLFIEILFHFVQISFAVYKR